MRYSISALADHGVWVSRKWAQGMSHFCYGGERDHSAVQWETIYQLDDVCALHLRAHHLQYLCSGNLVALIFATCSWNSKLAPPFCRATFGFFVRQTAAPVDLCSSHLY
jgi:hypothetical protein